MTFPDLPLIRWDVFISRVRIRWAHGICPESFSPPTAKALEGTDNHYRKQDMKPSKPMPKPAKKGAKGTEKAGKKTCK